jgi:hypothetical protein
MQVSTETGAPAQADTAPATTALATDNGSGGVVDSGWITALPEDTRKTAEAKNWRSPADAVKSYLDLQRAYTDVTQSAIKPPSADAPKEEWDAFAAKLGRPEKPDGYEFKLPEGLPETFPYDDTSAAKFKAWAHEAGLSPKQAQTLHDQFVKDQASNVTAFMEAAQKRETEAHQALVKDWGDPASETYKRNAEMANRALRHGGGEALIAELKGVGVLGPDGSVRAPLFAKLLSKVGTELYAEDSLYGGQGSSGPNPFAPGDSENLTKQAEIIRSDPDRARALIRLSGQDPKTWGL